MHFGNLGQYAGMLLNQQIHGEPIRFFRAQPCGCMDPRTNKFDRTHTLCEGSGIVREEIKSARGRPLNALIVDASTDKQFARVGPVELGQLIASIDENMISIAQDDRIIPTTRSRVETEQFIRGIGVGDTFRHKYLTSIERIFTTAGPVPRCYSLKADEVSSPPSWQIVWTDDGSNVMPQPGQVYSVRFRYTPIYTVLTDSIASQRTDASGARRSVRVVLQLVPPNDP